MLTTLTSLIRGYPTVLYLCRTIFGTDKAALAVNILATSIAVCFLYKIALMLTDSKALALLAGFIYAYSPQIMKWDGSLYSDNLRIFFVILVFICTFCKNAAAAKKSVDTDYFGHCVNSVFYGKYSCFYCDYLYSHWLNYADG